MTARDQRLYHLLQLAAHRVKVQADRDAQEIAGITAAQAAVLFVVARNPDTTQRVVADQLKQQESAVTAMVGRLIDGALLTRTQSIDDGRAWALNLTPGGREALAKFHRPLDKLNTAIAHALGDESRVSAFAVALRAILDMKLD